MPANKTKPLWGADHQNARLAELKKLMEVIEDEVTGLLVKPAHDSAALGRQLLRLLQDPELRRRIGVAGRRRVEEKFHLERNVTELLSHYAL